MKYCMNTEGGCETEAVEERGELRLCYTCAQAFDLGRNAENGEAIIEVRGGVAEVTECPRNVSVRIVDHDNAAVGE